MNALLDRATIAVPPGALTRRELWVLRRFFTLPVGVRQRWLFAGDKRGLLLQRLLQRALGRVATELDVAYLAGPLQGCRFRVNTAEKFLLLGTTFEEQLIASVALHARAGAAVYDVGAQAGYWALALARRVGPAGSVLVFEPSPRNFARLCHNLGQNATNPALGAVVPYPFAIGDRDGLAAFLEDDSRSHLCDAADGTQVPLRRLDTLVQGGAPLPELILIDVEGAAGGVLRGAEALLHAAHPALICEVHGARESDEITAVLRRHGYSTQSLGDNHAWPLHLCGISAPLPEPWRRQAPLPETHSPVGIQNPAVVSVPRSPASRRAS